MTKVAHQQIGMVLQARMGSTRMPGKVLMPLGKTTLLGWIVQRLRGLPWPLVIATSDQAQDDAIAEHCMLINVPCFRGSESDVLDRYYQCAVMYDFSHVIRLTGDNPCTDIEALQQLVELHLGSAADYSHSFGELPVGVGAEIFTFGSLQASWREGSSAHHREHVNEFILEQPARFHIMTLHVPLAKRAPNLRLTIDTPEDYRRMAAYLGDGVDVCIGTEALLKRCSSCV